MAGVQGIVAFGLRHFCILISGADPGFLERGGRGTMGATLSHKVGGGMIYGF